jgi:hypothetical protein
VQDAICGVGRHVKEVLDRLDREFRGRALHDLRDDRPNKGGTLNRLAAVAVTIHEQPLPFPSPLRHFLHHFRRERWYHSRRSGAYRAAPSVTE